MTCGEGNQTREVLCMYVPDSKVANDSLCMQNMSKPRTVRHCEASNCTKKWTCDHMDCELDSGWGMVHIYL